MLNVRVLVMLLFAEVHGNNCVGTQCYWLCGEIKVASDAHFERVRNVEKR